MSAVRDPVSRRRAKPRLLVSLLGLSLVVWSGACGGAGSSSPAPAEATPSGARPRVVLPSGTVYSVEIADTPEAQANGLKFRESLPEKTGMLFLFRDGGIHRFWMKNTMIPLDIIWLDPEGKVIFISANTPPCKADPCPNYGPDDAVDSVLEIAGGMAAKENVTVGARIQVEGVQK